MGKVEKLRKPVYNKNFIQNLFFCPVPGQNTSKHEFQDKPCRKQTMNTTDKWSVFKLTNLQSFGNMTSPALVGLGAR